MLVRTGAAVVVPVSFAKRVADRSMHPGIMRALETRLHPASRSRSQKIHVAVDAELQAVVLRVVVDHQGCNGPPTEAPTQQQRYAV